MMIWCMLNPSPADASKNDPTLRLVMAWARMKGFGGVTIVNLFAFRATKPDVLVNATLDIVGPDNDAMIREVCDRTTYPESAIYAGWGQGGAIRDRATFITNMLVRELGRNVWCLSVTQQGHPRHPLRVPYRTKPFIWRKAY